MERRYLSIVMPACSVSPRAGRVFLAAALAATLVPFASRAQTAHHEPSLGSVRFETSCSEAVRLPFERAVALLHHMTYPQARKAFEEVAASDPRCAMAQWGIAMTLFQPLWPTRPGPAELRRGWEAVERARALAPATERERLYVETVAAFFRDPEATDYWERIRRWERALADLYRSFPEDPEAAAFLALGHLAVAPADAASSEHAARDAAELLLTVYQANPAHPGAMHYLVHASDVPGRERESLAIVEKYETIAPDNPHALHMPTHVYTRLGDWDAVVRGNLRAAEAALAHPAGARGELVWDEFPHAIEYLVYAYLQQGADEAAASQVQRLHGTAALEPTFKTAFHLASTRARYALERGAWSEAMSLVPREPSVLEWDRFPWPEAVTWFARGLGAARTGSGDPARQAVARLSELESHAARAGEELFARQIRILRLGVEAWLAHVEGDIAAGVARMAEAAELERTTPKHAVTPAPTLPALELLGDLFSEQSRPAEALAAYERSLELYPRRYRSLLGAARAAHAAGDVARAARFYGQLLEVAERGARDAEISEAKAFLQNRGRSGG